MLITLRKDEIDLNILNSLEDKVNYNLLYRIYEGEEINALADENRNFLAMQNPNLQMWIWANPLVSEHKLTIYLEELCEWLEPQGKVNLVSSLRIYNLLTALKTIECKNTIHKGMTMIAYYCPASRSPINLSGKLIKADNRYLERLMEFQTGFVRDCFGLATVIESQRDTVLNLIGKGGLSLWSDNMIVSMANVTHKTAEFARINNVYTDPVFRGKGYCKMLLSAISKDLLSGGIIPMLYADAANGSSNKAYQDCGYLESGVMQEFVICFNGDNLTANY